VFHVDCYRIKSSKEARDLGLDDILVSKAILLVEWPENAGHMMPPLDRYFHLSHDADGAYRVLEER
jgi:tRNA threonylcarbamoyladenosine biosynthesis protein TsaE